MAAPPSSEAAPLPPIIKRSTSPAPSPSPASLAFAPPSPLHALPNEGSASAAMSPQTSYFSPQPQPHSPNPGILLNKGEGHLGRTSPHPAAAPSSELNHGLGMGTLRVSSPDGSTSESGLSSDGGFGGGGPASTAPSSAVGSPPAQGKPILSTLLATAPTGERAASPPSPHCHFAPLPKVDNDARPGTRRNSFATGASNRVKPYKAPPERSDSILSTASSAVDTDEDGHLSPSFSPTGLGSPVGGDPSIPTPSALSQRLSSSLTFAAPPAVSSSHSPSRPTSRRSSSSRRSRSPSPPPGISRSSSRGGGYHHHHPAHAHGHASRSHSPNLSRHASADALSLHYIEADRERSGAILSRTSSRAGSERDGGLSSASSAAGAGEEGAPFGRRGPSVERTRSSSNSPAFFLGSAPPPAASSGSATASATGSYAAVASSAGGEDQPRVLHHPHAPRDMDKEADLHRLERKAAAGNEDAERAVSPALRAQAARERSLSRGAVSGEEEEGEGRRVPKRKASNEEVVTVGPGEEKDPDGGIGGELEEVEEEPEEEEEEDEERGTDEEEGTDEGGTDEEDEVERSREEGEDEDEEDEEEEEEEMHEERKTSKGAAVEVVRWHRPERDEPAAVPGTSTPRPTATPRLGSETTIPPTISGGAAIASTPQLAPPVPHD
ncbi:hypothetical protein JCM8097_005916 [Rhodosporidiobolus ruineniae]